MNRWRIRSGRDCTLIVALTLSLAVHAAALGVVLWRITQFMPPTVVVSAGKGGDGITAGDSLIVEGAAEPTLSIELPQVPVSSSHGELNLDVPDVADALSSEAFTAVPVPPGVFDVTNIQIGATASASDQAMLQAWASARRARQIPAKPSEEIGDGGLGGDGWRGGAPTPSSRNKPPRYPPEARRLGYEGTVLLAVEVRAGGTVAEVGVEKSSGFEILDAAAIEAVQQWIFNPATASGARVSCRVRLPIQFVLRG